MNYKGPLLEQSEACRIGTEMHQAIEARRVAAYRDTHSLIMLSVLIGIAIGASLMLVMFEAINMLGNVG